MKRILSLAIATVMTTFAAQATIYTTNWSNALNPLTPFANGGIVPDNSYSGWSDSREISGQSGTITPGSLQVQLNLSGGWNGDLYAYLVNSSGGFAVLLDRVGYPASTYGYGNSGFDIALTTSGNPIESYQNFSPTYNLSGQLQGTWQWQSNPVAFLNPNGTWSLFIADLNGGDVTTVQSWGLQMDIVAVPEVESWIAAALAGAFGAFWLNRQIWGSKGAQQV